jgi:hypothetical protein
MIYYKYISKQLGPHGAASISTQNYGNLYQLLSVISDEAAVMWDVLDYIVPEQTYLISCSKYIGQITYNWEPLLQIWHPQPSKPYNVPDEFRWSQCRNRWFYDSPGIHRPDVLHHPEQLIE